jgi:hypothetical protein
MTEQKVSSDEVTESLNSELLELVKKERKVRSTFNKN